MSEPPPKKKRKHEGSFCAMGDARTGAAGIRQVRIHGIFTLCTFTKGFSFKGGVAEFDNGLKRHLCLVL